MSSAQLSNKNGKLLYAYTLSWHSALRRCVPALQLPVLQESTATASDVIGDPSGGGKGVMANLFTRGGGAGQQKKPTEAFAVGDRGAILHHLDQAAIIPHVAESENRKYPYEVATCWSLLTCTPHVKILPWQTPNPLKLQSFSALCIKSYSNAKLGSSERVAAAHRYIQEDSVLPCPSHTYRCVHSQQCSYPQVLFRSVHKLVMDTSTSEYLFCIDFFQDDSVYHELIAPTLNFIESALSSHLQV